VRVGMKIGEIQKGMRKVSVEGKIVNMNSYMLVVDDSSGRIFVRYSSRNLDGQIEKGNTVRICDSQAVSYSGILELRMGHKGHIVRQ
jgi:RNase P/RNase MRP subunit p29